MNGFTLVLLFCFPLAASATCSNVSCLADCKRSGRHTACSGIRCDADLHKRCICAGAAALRHDGSCSQTMDQATQCSDPTYHVLMNIAAWESPELNKKQIADGKPSRPLSAVLLRSVASGLSRPESQVRIVSTKFKRFGSSAGDHASSQQGLMHFDFEFEFCASVLSNNPESDIRAFERNFINEAQSFVLFTGGTMRVLSLSALGAASSSSATSELSTQQPKFPPNSPTGNEEAAPTTNQNDDTFLKSVWWMPWCFAVAALLVLGVAIWYRRYRLRAKSEIGQGKTQRDRQSEYLREMTLVGPDGIPLTWIPPGGLVDGAYAIASHAFSAAELMEADDGFKDSCLSLDAGDVLEVEASGGQWLYGKIANDPGRSGFFPMNRVAWLGRPLQEGIDTGPLGRPADLDDWSPPCSPANAIPPAKGLACAGSQADNGDSANGTTDTPAGPSVIITVPFHPSEVDDATGRMQPDMCLTLNGGEVVRVTGAGAGWLYGYVDNKPGRAGYFPEDRATWQSDAVHDT